MVRPIIGESFNNCKQFRWSIIHTSQQLIASIQKNCGDTPLAREIINLELANIKRTYAELRELQRWWNNEGKNNAEQRVLGKTVSNS